MATTNDSNYNAPVSAIKSLIYKSCPFSAEDEDIEDCNDIIG